jgi:hypothetical protein
MEWLTTGGEVYHHHCKTWTHSIEGGKCENCRAEIPEATLRVVREHLTEQARVARKRDVGRSLKELTRRFAETGARAETTLVRTSSAKKD